MKNMILLFFLFISLFFGQGSIYANQHKEESAPSFKIPLYEISGSTEIEGFETYYGKSFKTWELEGIETENINIASLLKRETLQLKNGESLRPEEIQFALGKKSSPTFRQEEDGKGGYHISKIPPSAE